MKWSIDDIFAADDYFGDLDPFYRRMLKAECETGTVALGVLRLPSDCARGRFQGKATHQWLCARTATWFSRMGKRWRAETWYAGGRADVGAMDGSVFAECGYTRSEKILAGLDAGSQMLVVPYGNDDEMFMFSRWCGELLYTRHVAKLLAACAAVEKRMR